jgi:hypothetical protein
VIAEPIEHYQPVFVSGKIRQVPVTVWKALKGPKPEHPESFINNGCTLSPDNILGKPTWPACVIHDFQYNHTPVSRAFADAVFRDNLKTCLVAYGTFPPIAWVVALFYWRGVRRAGRHAYNGTRDPS